MHRRKEARKEVNIFEEYDAAPVGPRENRSHQTTRVALMRDSEVTETGRYHSSSLIQNDDFSYKSPFDDNRNKRYEAEDDNDEEMYANRFDGTDNSESRVPIRRNQPMDDWNNQDSAPALRWETSAENPWSELSHNRTNEPLWEMQNPEPEWIPPPAARQSFGEAQGPDDRILREPRAGIPFRDDRMNSNFERRDFSRDRGLEPPERVETKTRVSRFDRPMERPFQDAPLNKNIAYSRVDEDISIVPENDKLERDRLDSHTVHGQTSVRREQNNHNFKVPLLMNPMSKPAAGIPFEQNGNGFQQPTGTMKQTALLPTPNTGNPESSRDLRHYNERAPFIENLAHGSRRNSRFENAQENVPRFRSMGSKPDELWEDYPNSQENTVNWVIKDNIPNPAHFDTRSTINQSNSVINRSGTFLRDIEGTFNSNSRHSQSNARRMPWEMDPCKPVDERPHQPLPFNRFEPPSPLGFQTQRHMGMGGNVGETGINKPLEFVPRFQTKETAQPPPPPPPVPTEWERQLAELRADADAAYASLNEPRVLPTPGSVETRRPLLLGYEEEDEEEEDNNNGLSQAVSEEDARRYGYETNVGSRNSTNMSGRQSVVSSEHDSTVESNNYGPNELRFSKMVAEFGLFFKCTRLPSQSKHGIEYYGYDVEVSI